jgi:hypothetical protein
MPVIDHDDIVCFFVSLSFGVLLMGFYAMGRVIRPRLPAAHRSREMTEVLLSVIAMLVTFSAIALGLMLNSSLNKLQHLNDLVSGLADRIVRLDDSLVEYGSDAQLAHAALANYTRRELAGLAEDSSAPMTRAALQQVESLITQFDAPDSYHEMMKRDALARYNDVIDVRFRLLSEGGTSSNLPFNLTLGFWLVLTFFVFGLNSERNTFIIVALTVSMCAIVVAIFVILDMDTALGGLISVSPDPLNLALAQLRQG